MITSAAVLPPPITSVFRPTYLPASSVLGNHPGVAVDREFAGDAAAEGQDHLAPPASPLVGDNRQRAPLLLDVLQFHLGLDVQVLVLHEMLHVLQITLHRHRLLGRTQLFHQEGVGGVLGPGGINQLPSGIGIGNSLAHCLARFENQVGEATLVAKVGGGQSGRPRADDDYVVKLFH
jgi:hypothetical protein